MFEKNCGTCEHWRDFCSFFEDPDEPDDVGNCFNDAYLKDVTFKEDVCSEWTVWVAMKDWLESEDETSS